MRTVWEKRRAGEGDGHGIENVLLAGWDDLSQSCCNSQQCLSAQHLAAGYPFVNPL